HVQGRGCRVVRAGSVAVRGGGGSLGAGGVEGGGAAGGGVREKRKPRAGRSLYKDLDASVRSPASMDLRNAKAREHRALRLSVGVANGLRRGPSHIRMVDACGSRVNGRTAGGERLLPCWRARSRPRRPALSLEANPRR